MIKRVFKLFLLLLMLSEGGFTQQSKLKFDFEEVKNGRLVTPSAWHITPVAKGYKAYIDKQVKKQGKYAMTLKSLPGRKTVYATFKLNIPAKYKGKKIKLIGYLKTQGVSNDGFAGLYLGVKDSEGVINFDNQRSIGITGTNNWKKYTVEISNSKYATYIIVGGILNGDGQIWIDDLQLFIDDVPITKATQRFYPPKAKRPEKFYSISKQNLQKQWQSYQQLADTIKVKSPDFAYYAALIYDGEIIGSLQQGWADRQRKLPMSTDVIHMWGSITKMLTSIAVLQLVNQGKLQLNDPVTKFIPELGKGVAKFGGMSAIKIYHLLNHNSGYVRDVIYDSLKTKHVEFKDRIPNTEEVTPFLKYATQKFRPGTKFKYNNGAYSLLGIIVERVSGTSYTRYIKQHIFNPLGMETAHFGKTPAHLQKFYGYSYYQHSKDSVNVKRDDAAAGIREANGGLKAKPADLLKLMDFLKFRKRKKFLKDYEKVLPKKVIQKYYYTLNPNDRSTFAKQFSTGDYTNYSVMGFSNDISNAKIKEKFKVIGHSGGIVYFISNFEFRGDDQPVGILFMCNGYGALGTPAYNSYLMAFRWLSKILKGYTLDMTQPLWSNNQKVLLNYKKELENKSKKKRKKR